MTSKHTFTKLTEFLRLTTPRNLGLALGVLLVLLTLTTFSTLYLKANVESVHQGEFDFMFNEIQVRITDRLTEEAQFLYAAAAFFGSTDAVTRDQWRTFTQQLRMDELIPGTQGIGFALLLSPDQLAQHIQEIRSQGFPNYQVTPDGERAAYSSIIYLEPFSGRNLRAFGYDMFSEPVRRAAMEQARDENIAVISGKVTLVQETGQNVQPGVLMYVPVYRHGAPVDTVEQRRAAILGWVYSPNRMADMMLGTLSGWDVKEKEHSINLQIYDGDVISPNTMLFDSQRVGDPLLSSTENISKLTRVNFAGRHWTLRLTELDGHGSTANTWIIWLTAIGGVGISLLAFGLVISVITTRSNAQQIAAKLTTDLRESEDRYRQMFEQNHAVKLLIDPVTGQILKANPAAARYYGYPIENLQQLSLSDITPVGLTETAMASQLVSTEKNSETNFHHRLSSGEVRQVEVFSSPLYLNGHHVLYSIIHDITDRKLVEERLTASEIRYRRLFETAKDGVLILDADTGRIVDVNPFLIELLGYSVEQFLEKEIWEIGIFKDIAANKEMFLELQQKLFVRYENLPLETADGRIAEVEFISNVYRVNQKKIIQCNIRDTTAHVEAERKIRNAQQIAARLTTDLRESEDRYRQMFEQNHAVQLLIDPVTSQILKANPAAASYYGYPIEKLQQLSLSDITPVGLTETAMASQMVLTEKNSGSNSYHRLASGEVRQVKVFSSPLNWNGHRVLYSIIHDITDRKLAEERLTASEIRYRRLFETAKDGILILDADTGRIVDVNPFLIELLGYTVEQFLEKEIWEIGIFKDIAANKEMFLELQQKLFVRYEDLPLETADGRIVEVEFVSNVYWVNQKKVIQCNIRDKTAHVEAERKIHSLHIEMTQLANIDGLTGINNHRSILKLAEHEFEVAVRYQPPLSMMFFDIDHFKQVNDTFGHAMGDQAIITIIQTVSAKLRSSDLIGRYGGDEFVILLPQTSAQDALPLAQRIQASIAAIRLETEKDPLTLAISIGIAQSIHEPKAGAEQPDTVEDLLRRADQALYAAKQAGRNCTRIYDPTMTGA